ncbi:MAG: ABC transporter substrate-binding protein [Candidatus Dormibacteria bacterium]
MPRFSALSLWRAAGGVAVAALLLAACGSLASGSRAPAKGGVATFAEGAAAAPQYILPLEGSSWFSVSNAQDLSFILYRPLFWFGSSGQPTFNDALSLGNTPKWSDNDQTVTVTLKHWRWSDGQPVTSRDVIFWMNLLCAAVSPAAGSVGSTSAPGPGWGAFVTGGFPQNVVSYQAVGNYEVVFHLNASYDPTWFLYNELSQIYPMPQHAWDKLSPSGAVGNYDASAEARAQVAPASTPATYQPSAPGTASSGALGVAQFLNLQSEDTSTYSTNPLWKVVDGPFRLVTYTTAGFIKFVPNAKYSGPDKAKLSAFEEIPFTTDTAEFNELRAGDLTMGYIPPNDIAQKGYMEHHGYSFAAWNSFNITYFPYNFTEPTTGPIFKQLYFRQAFQSLVNQPEWISRFLAGYASVTNGPVPTFPKGNPDVTKLETAGQVYPYNPSKAVALLKDHGWKVVPGGTSTCVKPGTGSRECGAGIASGAQLSFRLLYESGVTYLTQEMEALKSNEASVAGIQLTLSTAPFGQVISDTFGGACSPSSPCSSWDMGNWGGGWVYSPDYYPTGEELFETGASSNPGYYSDPEADRLIRATNTNATAAGETRALDQYENYIAKQLPVVWVPTASYQLEAYKSNLKGYLPQGVFLEIYPEDYSF